MLPAGTASPATLLKAESYLFVWDAAFGGGLFHERFQKLVSTPQKVIAECLMDLFRIQNSTGDKQAVAGFPDTDPADVFPFIGEWKISAGKTQIEVCRIIFRFRLAGRRRSVCEFPQGAFQP